MLCSSQGCRALVWDMGRLPLPAFEFQIEMLLFEWKKKVLQTLVHFLLPACGLLGGLWTPVTLYLCCSHLTSASAALPAASLLSSLLCCSWVPLPAQGRPSPPEVLFRARGGQRESWDFIYLFV